MVVNTYVDDVMRLLLKELNVVDVKYNPKLDPTKKVMVDCEERLGDFTKIEWTIGQRAVSTTRKRLSKSLPQLEPKPKKTKIKKKNQDEEDDLHNSETIKIEPLEAEAINAVQQDCTEDKPTIDSTADLNDFKSIE